jgi:hypothetical protein
VAVQYVAKGQNRTRTANAICFHFGDGATTSSAASKTFAFMEFQMAHDLVQSVG